MGGYRPAPAAYPVGQHADPGAGSSRVMAASSTVQGFDPDAPTVVQPAEGGPVAGLDRWKFFKRPVVPHMEQIPVESAFGATAEAQEEAMFDPAHKPANEAPTKTVSVQTVYRESEAQTLPYAPDYLVRPGSQPELLALTELKWGHGLPPTQLTMDMIEKNRQKRRWLTELPPMDSEENIELRRKMMEERELLEWEEREKEINDLQAHRLKQLEKAMVARENDNAYLEDQRIEFIRQQKMAGKEKVLTTIQQKRVKTIRRLADQRKAVEGKKEKRDIISEYANSGSKAYAPLARDGLIPRDLAKRVDHKQVPEDLLSLEGLDYLEATLPQKYKPTIAQKPQPKKPVTTSERKAANLSRDLEAVDQTLKLEKAKGTTREKPVSYLKKVELPPPRPPTPSVEKPEEDEDLVVAVILVQRLLRGRAVQNEMFEGKEKRLELIRELQIVETHKEEEEAATIRANELREHQEAKVDATLESLEGEIVGQTLDFLSKELVRHQEEKRIAELMSTAEQTRRMREASQSGLRQKEERIRSEQDARFETLVRVYQQSVDSYLEDLFRGAVENTSSLQAIHETRVKSENIMNVLDNLEDKLNPPEVVVEDLVQHYLLPNVQNETNRREDELDELKFPLAAKQIVAQLAENVVEEMEKCKEKK